MSDETAQGVLPPRALIYSFRFDSAKALLARAELSVPEKLRARLLKAVEYNEASTLPVVAPRDAAEPVPVGRWWEVWPSDTHLRVKGYVSAECLRVGLFVNDRLVKLVNTVPRHGDAQGRRVFRFNLKSDIMKALPKKTVIGIGSEVGYLRRRSGGLSYRDPRLNGTGTLFRKLASGHFLTKKGRLQRRLDENEEWKESILDAYTVFRKYFEERFDYKPYIICGTLLGHHREGDFIAHDDDMDVAYFSRHSRPEDVRQEMATIVQAMLADGYDIKLARKPGFFKPTIGGLSFDVFPMWHDLDCLWMMNTTRQRSGPERILPVSTARFRGVDVYVPNQIEAYIASEYGPNWRVPDPGYRSIGEPGTSEYLLRSCLSVEEVAEILDRVAALRAEGISTGKLSVAERDLQAWVAGANDTDGTLADQQ